MDDAKKIIIFGIGKRGKEAFDIIRQTVDIEIIGFIDNAPNITEIGGISVFKANDFLLCAKKFEFSYIISGKYALEMYWQLIEAGIDENDIYTMESYLVHHLQTNDAYSFAILTASLTPPAAPMWLSFNKIPSLRL